MFDTLQLRTIFCFLQNSLLEKYNLYTTHIKPQEFNHETVGFVVFPARWTAMGRGQGAAFLSLGQTVLSLTNTFLPSVPRVPSTSRKLDCLK